MTIRISYTQWSHLLISPSFILEMSFYFIIQSIMYFVIQSIMANHKLAQDYLEEAQQQEKSQIHHNFAQSF